MHEPSAFRVRDGRARGATPGQLRSTRLAAPFHGVRSTFEPVTAAERCRVYAAKMRQDAVFTSVSAARLWGVPLPAWLADDLVHVAAPLGTARPGGRGVAGSLYLPGAVTVTEMDGLRMLSAADTWASLGTVLPLADLVAAGDFLVTPSFASSVAPATTLDELRAVAGRPGFRGARLARAAARLVRVGPLSRPESLSRVLVVSGGVPEPICNLRVSPLLTFDLAWPQWRLGFDYHGATHRSAAQHAKDVARGDLARQLGWAAMQASSDDLFDAPFDLLGRIRSRLAARGAPLAPIDVRKVVTARR